MTCGWPPRTGCGVPRPPCWVSPGSSPSGSTTREYEALTAAGDLEGLVAVGLREWAAAGADEAAAAQLRAAVPAWLNGDSYRQEDPPVFERLGELDVPAVLMVGDLGLAVTDRVQRAGGRRHPRLPPDPDARCRPPRCACRTWVAATGSAHCASAGN